MALNTIPKVNVMDIDKFKKVDVWMSRELAFIRKNLLTHKMTPKHTPDFCHFDTLIGETNEYYEYVFIVYENTQTIFKERLEPLKGDNNKDPAYGGLPYLQNRSDVILGNIKTILYCLSDLTGLKDEDFYDGKLKEKIETISRDIRDKVARIGLKDEDFYDGKLKEKIETS